MDFEMNDCGGCETCEIACSFRHTKEFNHLVSSIEIIGLEDRPGYKVRITEDPSGGRFACDGCAGLDEPMCVQYCPKREKLTEIIETFKSQCLREKKGRD
jgi:Fe-S-cluster-containing hydrogenase component 2